MPVYAINKSPGMTSHAVISCLRKITGIRRIGHAGTLDPLASGVLVVGIGREATRSLVQITAEDKEYLAEITLGITSATDDAEGPLITREAAIPPLLSDINSVFPKYIGEIKQKPPQFSAIKIHGRAAYHYARNHKSINLGWRSVTIHSITLVSYEYPKLSLKVHTGSGVYIRSLARDLGTELGTGAYLSRLVRTRIGNYNLESALTLDQFAARHHSFLPNNCGFKNLTSAIITPSA